MPRYLRDCICPPRWSCNYKNPFERAIAHHLVTLRAGYYSRNVVFSSYFGPGRAVARRLEGSRFSVDFMSYIFLHFAVLLDVNMGNTWP